MRFRIQKLLLVLITILLQGCETKQKPDYIKNRSESRIENLDRGDTLFLYASYSECGEFGGHREVVKLFLPELDSISARKQDSLYTKTLQVPRQSRPIAIWLRDTIVCENTAPRRLYQVGRIVISESQGIAIEEYMHRLLTKGLGKQNFESNASNGFAARFYSVTSGKDAIQVYYYDSRQVWDEFSPLRNQLFGVKSKK